MNSPSKISSSIPKSKYYITKFEWVSNIFLFISDSKKSANNNTFQYYRHILCALLLNLSFRKALLIIQSEKNYHKNIKTCRINPYIWRSRRTSVPKKKNSSYIYISKNKWGNKFSWGKYICCFKIYYDFKRLNCSKMWLINTISFCLVDNLFWFLWELSDMIIYTDIKVIILCTATFMYLKDGMVSNQLLIANYIHLKVRASETFFYPILSYFPHVTLFVLPICLICI